LNQERQIKRIANCARKADAKCGMKDPRECVLHADQLGEVERAEIERTWSGASTH
jgi:hypothetical protein